MPRSLLALRRGPPLPAPSLPTPSVTLPPPPSKKVFSCHICKAGPFPDTPTSPPPSDGKRHPPSKNAAHPGPRISMLDPHGRPRVKSGKPRSRPPAARSPNNVAQRHTDSQERILGFDHSPNMTGDQDPPPISLTSSSTVSPDVSTPPSTNPPAINEGQLSFPASPASSQDLFVPPPSHSAANKTRGIVRREPATNQTKRVPPPLGNKTNDPASVPTEPPMINDTLHLPSPSPQHLYARRQLPLRPISRFILDCQTDPTPSKVSDHACFKVHPHVNSLDNNLQFRQTCQFSSSTKRGLNNHMAAHKRIMATPNVSLPQKAPNRNRKPRELLTAAPDPCKSRPDMERPPSSPRFCMRPHLQRVQILEDQNDEETIDSPEPRAPRPTPRRQHRSWVPNSTIPPSHDAPANPTPSPSPGGSSQR
ncbi:hypothetical protein JTE90_023242 [Oedothorax gibbosus]|uniref:Uncharacterized protein n=1 Tax=Oedothorax gibbosus TaxID=931172 RepID=A0AAV6TPK2_9ARAC|nr:hypothetical protein JTE90_023242 [Oedothorax gibbosus]